MSSSFDAGVHQFAPRNSGVAPVVVVSEHCICPRFRPVKLPQPPLFSLFLGIGLAVFLWLLDAGTWEVFGALGCGVAYALFYLVVKPRKD